MDVAVAVLLSIATATRRPREIAAQDGDRKDSRDTVIETTDDL